MFYVELWVEWISGQALLSEWNWSLWSLYIGNWCVNFDAACVVNSEIMQLNFEPYCTSGQSIKGNIVFTAQIRSAAAGYIFSLFVCSHLGGGTPSPFHNTSSSPMSRRYPIDWFQVPSQGNTQWLVPGPFPGKYPVTGPSLPREVPRTGVPPEDWTEVLPGQD